MQVPKKIGILNFATKQEQGVKLPCILSCYYYKNVKKIVFDKLLFTLAQGTKQNYLTTKRQKVCKHKLFSFKIRTEQKSG